MEDIQSGNIAVDANTGDVYQVFVGCPPSATAVVTCSAFNTASMAVGVPATTGGVTTLSFTDYATTSRPTPRSTSATTSPGRAR